MCMNCSIQICHIVPHSYYIFDVIVPQFLKDFKTKLTEPIIKLNTFCNTSSGLTVGIRNTIYDWMLILEKKLKFKD